MLDLIYSLFSAIVSCITNIITVIVSIPRYINAFFVFVNTLIPSEIIGFVTLIILGYVIIHLKRLIIS